MNKQTTIKQIEKLTGLKVTSWDYNRVTKRYSASISSEDKGFGYVNSVGVFQNELSVEAADYDRLVVAALNSVSRFDTWVA